MDGEIKIESAADMAGLEPQDDHQYLVVMYQAQRLILKRQEEFNGFRRDCEKRVGRLEGSVGGVIGALALAAAVWALNVLLGG